MKKTTLPVEVRLKFFKSKIVAIKSFFIMVQVIHALSKV